MACVRYTFWPAQGYNFKNLKTTQVLPLLLILIKDALNIYSKYTKFINSKAKTISLLIVAPGVQANSCATKS